MRLREHTISGTVTNVGGLSAAHTTLSSDELVKLPELAAGYDYYVAVLDPAAVENGPEIVYITVHTAGATPNEWATIIRGREDTAEVSHAVDTQILFHPFTSKDFRDEKTRYAIDLPKHTADTPDDEFEYTDGDLDAKWTLSVSEAAATVVNEVVDDQWTVESDQDMQYWVDKGLTVKAWGSVGPIVDNSWGQDYTLLDGQCIVAKVSPGSTSPDTGGPDAFDSLVGLYLNDSDTGHRAGNYSGIYFQSSGDASRFYHETSGSLTSAIDVGHVVGDSFYLMIQRSGTVYYPFHSATGRNWHPGDGHSIGVACDNVWLWAYSDQVAGVRSKHTKFDWIRVGDSDNDPAGTGVPW